MASLRQMRGKWYARVQYRKNGKAKEKTDPIKAKKIWAKSKIDSTVGALMNPYISGRQEILDLTCYFTTSINTTARAAAALSESKDAAVWILKYSNP